jgi:fructose-1,6-bisphosphatase/inositol monophosphatase family enzyme
VDPDALLDLCHQAADAVADVLASTDDWGPSGARPGQYAVDLRADEAALAVLRGGGVGVLSEESGLERGDADVVVVLDPLDGSTNASRGVPWFATSLCAVDARGPLVAVVADQARGVRWTAIRGGGASCDEVPLTPVTSGRTWAEALVGLSGLPPEHLGWGQFRALGAVALDLCLVAAGAIDAYLDCSRDAHGPWDYLGALLVCAEAGVPVVDARGRDLVVLDPSARRTPVAATPSLLPDALAARRRFP